MYGDELYIQKISGEIIEIIEQPRFWLGVPENVYIADFLCIKEEPYVIDVKGVWTAKFRRDVILWREYARLPLHIVARKKQRFETTYIIEPKWCAKCT